jgi:hypothetical protein
MRWNHIQDNLKKEKAQTKYGKRNTTNKRINLE